MVSGSALRAYYVQRISADELVFVRCTEYTICTVLCTREGPDLILAARHAKLGCTSGPRPCLAAGGTLLS